MSYTKGPWRVDVWDYSHANPPRKELNIQNESNLIATLQCDYSGFNPYIISQKEAESNARLIAEAGTVAHETGKTPRQLTEENRELLEALKCLLALVEGECPSLLEDDHHSVMCYNAIAKAEGTRA